MSGDSTTNDAALAAYEASLDDAIAARMAAAQRQDRQRLDGLHDDIGECLMLGLNAPDYATLRSLYNAKRDGDAAEFGRLMLAALARRDDPMRDTDHHLDRLPFDRQAG